MAIGSTFLSLQSDQNEILLNPRWPQSDYQALRALAEDSQKKLGLKGHVWIATSGSTAEALSAIKLVALSKKALWASAHSVNQHLRAGPTDVWTQVLPRFHVGGLGIEIRAQLAGSRVVRALLNEKWDVHHYHKLVGKEGCTLSALVPTQIYDLVVNGYRAPETLRAVVVGGGAFEEPLYLQARALGWPVLPSYGMTETASQIATASLSSLHNSDFPEVGLLSHAKARTNSEGFLEVWAESLFTCYAQSTPDGPRCWSPLTDEGWFVTEDRGEVSDGNLKIQGRSKDYVKIGGEATNLARLRSLLEAEARQLNPRWSQSLALLDMPSDRLGHEIHLVSLLSEEETKKVVGCYAEKVLPYERIRKIHFVDSIPRSDLGKVLWGELRRNL